MGRRRRRSGTPSESGALLRYALLWAGALVLVVLVALGWFRMPEDRRDARGRHAVPADVVAAARAADCSYRRLARAREEMPDRPPTVGDRHVRPAPDAMYEQPPPEGALRGALARGRVVIQFHPELIAGERSALERLYHADRYATILTPNRTGMRATVAATAWFRLLECPTVNRQVLAAIDRFRDRFRGRGPG